VFSDSAFKKEEQTGHCMRGAAYLLCPGDHDDAFKGTASCHIIDFISRQQRKSGSGYVQCRIDGRMRCSI
ncbi:MAG: hypothetical protein ACKPKO_30435, partial [Candidatus Fonsibacter sp.]